MPTFLNESAPLQQYTHNLTLLAQQGAFAPLAGEDAVIDRVFQVMGRKHKNVPVILSADETRRWAIVAEVVRRMTVGDAPAPFPKQQVVALNFEALFSNLSDDTAMRRERREQQYAPLQERLYALNQLSDEEWWACVGDIPLWPSLEEWIAPDMALARLQSFVAEFARLRCTKCGGGVATGSKRLLPHLLHTTSAAGASAHSLTESEKKRGAIL